VGEKDGGGPAAVRAAAKLIVSFGAIAGDGVRGGRWPPTLTPSFSSARVLR